MYRRQQEQSILDSQAITLYEITKLKNFINTTNFITEDLNEEEIFNDDPIDFDWLISFFDVVGNISNKKSQKIMEKSFSQNK